MDNGGNVGTTRRSFGRGPVFPQGGGRKHVEPRGDKGENRREIRKVGREEKLFASLQRFNVTSAFGECMPPLRKSCKSRRVPLSSRANLLPFLSSSSWGITRSNNSSYSPEQHGGKLKNLSFWKRSRKDKMTGCVLASLTPSVYNIYARI